MPAARSALALIVLLLVAVPAAADARSHRHELRPTQERQATLTFSGERGDRVLQCPSRSALIRAFHRLLNGTASVTHEDTASGATFQVVNLEPGQEVSVRLVITCRARRTTRAGGHDHPVLAERVVKRDVQLAGHRGATVSTTCPKGTFAIGGSYTPTADVRVHSSMPTRDGSGWTYDAINLGESPGALTVSTRCADTVTGSGGDPKGHRHRITRLTVRASVDVPSSPMPQQETVRVEGTIGCPSGTIGLGEGFSHLGHPYTYLGSFYRQPVGTPPSDRMSDSSFNFEILNQSTEQTAKLALVCVGATTGATGNRR